MTDPEIENYLRANGYPGHIVTEGRLGLVRRWREFVLQVERGYTLGLEDYRNDLDVRGIIALVGAEDDEIRALDERLKRMLTATNVRVWESAGSSERSGSTETAGSSGRSGSTEGAGSSGRSGSTESAGSSERSGSPSAAPLESAPVWDFGYPSNAGPELLRDLREENLVPDFL